MPKSKQLLLSLKCMNGWSFHLKATPKAQAKAKAQAQAHTDAEKGLRHVPLLSHPSPFHPFNPSYRLSLFGQFGTLFLLSHQPLVSLFLLTSFTFLLYYSFHLYHPHLSIPSSVSRKIIQRPLHNMTID